MALAAVAHILEDQAGFMGTNLLFPLTRGRTLGWKLFRSGDAIPNTLTVWICMALILLNLDRFSGTPHLPVVPFVLAAIGLPCLLALAVWAWTKRPVMHPPAVVQAAIEALDETAELDI
jgi:hypothetical protein